MKDMILFPEDIERLNAVLAPLVTKANLLLAVLINRDGRVLTNQGNLEHIDIVSLAALVAGNTASSVAIATLVGETEFSTMLHQGKEKTIYIAGLDENTFLAVVFDDRTNIDRVKVFIRQFERQMKEALTFVYDKDEDMIDLDLDMSNSSFANIPQEAGSQSYYPPPGQNQQNTTLPQQANPYNYGLVQDPKQPSTPAASALQPQRSANNSDPYVYLQAKINQGNSRPPV